MYLPYWTYDSHTETDYVGQRGTIYVEPVRVTRVIDGRRVAQTEMVQKVRWEPVRGHVRRYFNDVVVLGSRTLPAQVTDRLGPWDLQDLRPYTPEYLTGFQSEAYQVALGAGFENAKEQMRAALQSRCRRRHRRRPATHRADGDQPPRADLQAHPAAGLARRVPLRRQGLPPVRQRPHRPGPGRAPLQRLEDRVRGAPRRRSCSACSSTPTAASCSSLRSNHRERQQRRAGDRWTWPLPAGRELANLRSTVAFGKCKPMFVGRHEPRNDGGQCT